MLISSLAVMKDKIQAWCYNTKVIFLADPEIYKTVNKQRSRISI